MESLLTLAMVVGAVELVKQAFDRNYRVVCIIVAAAVVGGLCGYFGVENLDVAKGIVTGLAGSGVVTVAKKI